MASQLGTQFAPAERAGRGDLVRERELLAQEPLFREALTALPDIVMILNAQRQVMFANPAARRFVVAPESGFAECPRPGEWMGCIHATEGAAGCGTTTACRYCGAVRAILTSQAGVAAMEDCRVTVRRNGQEEALDLRVWASPIRVRGEVFTLFVAADIADEKRRIFLERIFLHDLSNTVCALRAFAQLMNSRPLQESLQLDYSHRVERLSDRLAEEINAHRLLMSAESGHLEVQWTPLRAMELLAEVQREFDCDGILNGRHLLRHPGSQDAPFLSDPALLSRVIKNMVRNALEAAVPGDEVTLGCGPDGAGVLFWVHNPTYMEEKVRSQVFQRSFSTKGPGRGLGTYSMKYLSEHYLRGRVDFTSTKDQGTTFRAWYPAN